VAEIPSLFSFSFFSFLILNLFPHIGTKSACRASYGVKKASYN